MGAGSTQGPLGTTPVPPIDAGTTALIVSPTLAPVGADAGTAPPTVTVDNDAEIEGLNLTGNAKRGAYTLKKAHPSVQFTSGFREKADQASAMAQNVVKKRSWIGGTYYPTKVSAACQKWV